MTASINSPNNPVFIATSMLFDLFLAFQYRYPNSFHNSEEMMASAALLVIQYYEGTQVEAVLSVSMTDKRINGGGVTEEDYLVHYGVRFSKIILPLAIKGLNEKVSSNIQNAFLSMCIPIVAEATYNSKSNALNGKFPDGILEYANNFLKIHDFDKDKVRSYLSKFHDDVVTRELLKVQDKSELSLQTTTRQKSPAPSSPMRNQRPTPPLPRGRVAGNPPPSSGSFWILSVLALVIGGVIIFGIIAKETSSSRNSYSNTSPPRRPQSSAPLRPAPRTQTIRPMVGPPEKGSAPKPTGQNAPKREKSIFEVAREWAPPIKTPETKPASPKPQPRDPAPQVAPNRPAAPGFSVGENGTAHRASKPNVQPPPLQNRKVVVDGTMFTVPVPAGFKTEDGFPRTVSIPGLGRVTAHFICTKDYPNANATESFSVATSDDLKDIHLGTTQFINIKSEVRRNVSEQLAALYNASPPKTESVKPAEFFLDDDSSIGYFYQTRTPLGEVTAHSYQSTVNILVKGKMLITVYGVITASAADNLPAKVKNTGKNWRDRILSLNKE